MSDWLDKIDTLDKARAEYQRLMRDDDLGGESERRLLAKWPAAATAKLAGDEHMGTFVYCASHLRPHSTGWCTVGPDHKIPLSATDVESAYAEVREIGLYVFGSDPLRGAKEDYVGDLMTPLARACRQRHYADPETPEPHKTERDRLLRKVREIWEGK